MAILAIMAIILETAARRAKICSISTPLGRKRVYVQPWNFSQQPSFMPKYGNLKKNGQYLHRKPLPVELKISSILTYWGTKTVCVQLPKHLLMAKFHAQIWQFWKLGCDSEIAARRANISLISTPWGRKSSATLGTTSVLPSLFFAKTGMQILNLPANSVF